MDPRFSGVLSCDAALVIIMSSKEAYKQSSLSMMCRRSRLSLTRCSRLLFQHPHPQSSGMPMISPCFRWLPLPPPLGLVPSLVVVCVVDFFYIE